MDNLEKYPYTPFYIMLIDFSRQPNFAEIVLDYYTEIDYLL